MKNTDKKIREFGENLILKIVEMSSQDVTFSDIQSDNAFSEAIDQTERLILEGIADDMDLEKGLNAVLDLAKLFNSLTNFTLLDAIKAKVLLNKWIDCMGLKYSSAETSNQSFRENILINSLVKFRSQVREVALNSLKTSKGKPKDERLFREIDNNNKEVLSLCDDLRHHLNSFGIKLKASPQ